MKAMKKLFAMLLAVLMVVGMLATTAVADDTYTITIKNEAKDHVYEAYQVFSGTLSDSGVLSDVQWGTGVKGDELLKVLKDSKEFEKDGVNAFAGCADAADVAKVVGGWGFNDTSVKNFADVVATKLSDIKATSAAQADGKYVITVGAVGYYFIKDAQAVTGADAATDYLLQVVKSIEVTPKVSAPTFKKTVNTELNTTYQEAIDAQIGDTVYFKLETKLPSLYNDYEQYVMIMEDVLPTGLTFNKVEDIYIAHAVGGHTSYLNSYTADNETTNSLEYAKKYGFDMASSKLTVNFGDLKETQANPNLNDTFTVKYSAIVNSDAVYGLGNKNNATLKFSNDMNKADDEAKGSLSDSASVYTYQLEVTKKDGMDATKTLQGAEFYLYRNFVVKDDQGGESTVKKYAHTNEDGVITGWSESTPTSTLKSGADGTFVIKGLDSLAYHLEEVKAPDGYNKLEDPVLVTITGTITDHKLTALTGAADGIAGTGDVDEGKVSVVVNNTLGSTLPATGGIGTTIFYIVGGVLVLGAAAAFVMKKRNEA